MKERASTPSARIVTPDRILEQLRIDIITRRYRNGERIGEADVAEKFASSRGSVRTALQALEAEGLIRVLPNGRREVVGFNRKLAHDMYSLRWMMENRAVEIAQQERTSLYAPILAVLRRIEASKKKPVADTDWYALDIDFHRALVQAADNLPLLKAWEINAPVMYALLRLNTTSDYQEQYVEEFYMKHWSLFQAIISDDPKCYDLLRVHIDDAEAITVRMLGE